MAVHNAIWSNRDHDIPITVTGWTVEKNTRQIWLAIAGSYTMVPESEVTFISIDDNNIIDSIKESLLIPD